MKDTFIEFHGENVVAYLTDDRGMTGQAMVSLLDHPSESAACAAATDMAMKVISTFYNETGFTSDIQ